MGWQLQTRPDAVLQSGTVIKFTLHFRYIPFTGVGESQIKQALEANTQLFVSSAEQSFVQIITFSDAWEIYGSIQSDTSVGELSTNVSTALNNWYSWGVSVSDIQTQTWTPDITPTTQTAVSLVAIAVIVVILFLLLKKENLL